MTYQGSKRKYAKYICPIIQDCINKNNIQTYIEPFVGGANIIKNIKCSERIASDNNQYLIALWKYLLANPQYEFPEYPNKDIWNTCKDNPELMEEWYIGLISIFCSNMAGGFPAGYDKIGSRYNGRIKNIKKDLPLLTDVKFIYSDYKNIIKNTYNTVIYCDPPYKNTHTYNYNKFDHDTFWDIMKNLSLNNYIFISEQIAPDDFNIIWEQEVNYNIRGNNRTAKERLYIYNEGLAFNYLKEKF